MRLGSYESPGRKLFDFFLLFWFFPLFFSVRQVHKLGEWEGFRNFKDISVLATKSRWGIIVLSASLLPGALDHVKASLMSDVGATAMLEVTASLPRPDRLLVCDFLCGGMVSNRLTRGLFVVCALT